VLLRAAAHFDVRVPTPHTPTHTHACVRERTHIYIILYERMYSAVAERTQSHRTCDNLLGLPVLWSISPGRVSFGDFHRIYGSVKRISFTTSDSTYILLYLPATIAADTYIRVF